MTEPSILSQARKQDEKLCEELEAMRQALPAQGSGHINCDMDGNPISANYTVWDDGKRLRNPDGPRAAARIRELNQALMEASHDRDRFMADAERRRRTKK